MLVNDLERLQLLKQSLELARESRDALEQASEELPADHRGELHGALAVLAEPIQARHDDVVDGVRDGGVPDRSHDSKAAVVTLQNAEVEEGLRDFLHEERHPLRLVDQRPRHVGGEALDAEHPARHGQRVGFR